MRIAHISDLHFGPLYDEEVGESLMQSLAAANASTLIVSGDLTQRATPSQFQAARRYLERAAEHFETIVVCPGNHDIALYRVWERMLRPFHLFQKFIHPELDRVVKGKDMTIVSLNSVRPWSRLVQGSLSPKQFRMVAKSFKNATEKCVHLLVCHHPVITFRKEDHHPGLDVPWSEISGGERVDIVLTGHRHETDVLLIHPEGSRDPMLLVSCGTSSSKRGRGAESGKNSFHLIEGDRNKLCVKSYLYNPGSKAFEISYEGSYKLALGEDRSVEATVSD